MSHAPRTPIEAAEQALRGHHVEVTPGARARVARGLDQTLAGPRVTWPMAFASVVAAAAVIAVSVTQSEPAVDATPRRSALVAGRTLVVGGAQVTPAEGARIERLTAPKMPEVLRLWRGQAHIDVPAAAGAVPVELETRQASLRFVGARLTVRASEDETLVTVERGTVQISAGGAQRTVTAGRRVRIGPPVHEAAQHDRPAPRTAPEPTKVAARPPGPAADIEARLARADVHRRQGRLRAAVQLYAGVLEHPARGPYEEEARFLIATTLDRLGRRARAERHLAEASRQHPGGPLAPERAALWARIRLDAGDPAGAARVLEASAGQGWSRVLDERRIEVARALVADPARAGRLLELVIHTSPAPDLVRIAQQERVKVSSGTGDP